MEPWQSHKEEQGNSVTANGIYDKGIATVALLPRNDIGIVMLCDPPQRPITPAFVQSSEKPRGHFHGTVFQLLSLTRFADEL